VSVRPLTMTDPTVAVPSTPIASRLSSSDPPPPPQSTSRRSQRVHKRDPVVLPGFGTQQDLIKLSNQLQLPEEAVEVIMKSQGRGIRRRGTDGAAEEVADQPIANAWADFMNEDDEDDKKSEAKEEVAEEEEDPVDPAANRVYVLPLVPEWKITGPSRAEAPKLKKAKPTVKSGVLVQAGTMDSTCVGRTKRAMDQAYDLPVPHVLMPKIQFTKVFTSCNACHMMAVDTAGNAYGWGRNEMQQLSEALPTVVAGPTLLEGISNVVDAAMGKSHTIVLDSSHTLYAVGSNKVGQCGIKSSIDAVPNWRKCILAAGVKPVQISAGEQLSVFLSDQGDLYTTGSSEFGQLGNGETGEYIQTAGKSAFANCNVFTLRSTFCHVPGEKLHGSAASNEKAIQMPGEEIKLSHVACGKAHVVAIECVAKNHPPRVFSWGCGNYGCLGHGAQKDEYFPRLVGNLSLGHVFKSNPPVKAIAGASCSMVLTQQGHVYYCGKHRSVGEAMMRPTLLAELANNSHVVTQVGAGAQTVVCSTKNAATVSWGQGPHGELGLEGKKSSAKPQFVATLDKCLVISMACGYGSTLFIVQQEDKDDAAAIATIPVVSDAMIEELANTKN
jgi:alpha-tubulin suppressor-like RCC1 family protein